MMDEQKKPCCCAERHTVRNDAERKSLMNRLKRIEGQVRGLQNMLERDAYCADVLTQSAAVGAALNAFNRELLTRHLHTCVVRDVRAGDDSAMDELAELAELVGRLMK